jgi:hypothetical protein
MDNFENWYTRHRALINITCLLAQVSLFLLVHNISISYFLEYRLFSSKDISWGISVEYIIYEFVVLFLTQYFFIYQFPQKNDCNLNTSIACYGINSYALLRDSSV